MRKHIVREDVPCWFELSWQKEKCSILFRSHKQFVASVPVIKQDAPIVVDMKKRFDFNVFGGSLHNDFGFEKSFAYIGEEGDFILHLITIPKVKLLTEEDCRNCQGSGKNPHYNRETCPSCNGDKKDHDYDWKSALAISASLTLFSMFERYPQVETSCQFPQLLTFRTITDIGSHGGSIGGEYSISLCRWLASFPKNTTIPEMERPMMLAHDRMIGLRNYDKHSFRAYLPYGNGWLNVSSPGDACGLHPSDGSVYPGEGYRFDCHNVDTPIQQITLLAGLAGLHDLARKEVK